MYILEQVDIHYHRPCTAECLGPGEILKFRSVQTFTVYDKPRTLYYNYLYKQ